MRLMALSVYKEVLIFVALLLGLYKSVGVDSILPLILNFFLSLTFLYSTYKQFGSLKWIKRLKLCCIAIQLGLNVELNQFGLIIIHLIENQLDIKAFILVSVFLFNLIRDQEFNYVTQLPFNLLYYVNLVGWIVKLFFKWKEAKNEKQGDQYIEQTFKQKSLEQPINNRDLQSKSNSVSQLNQIKLDINEDDLVTQYMSWIQNQSALVYNKNLNIVYQNLYLGKLLRHSNLDELQTQQQSKPDYEELFLECQILVGSKELLEINSNNNEQSMNSEYCNIQLVVPFY